MESEQREKELAQRERFFLERLGDKAINSGQYQRKKSNVLAQVLLILLTVQLLVHLVLFVTATSVFLS